MIDYQRKGYTRYGADMGRRSDLAEDTTATLTLRHVPLTDDYDPGGAYWGGPDNLYCASDDEGHVGYVRASDGDAARSRFPNARWSAVSGDPSDQDINEMLNAYITCALWSSNDESDERGGEPFDANYSAVDLTDEARETMRVDVEAFAKANAATIVACFGFKRCDWTQAGHDLWLTRNGHGCGFWDGGWPEAEGKALDTASEALGSCDLYLGDDGRIYVS